MKRRKLAVISGGLAQPSSTRLLADRLAMAGEQALAEFDVETEIDMLDLRDHARELTNMLVTGFADERLGAAIKEVVESDGLIAVTPIFNASYSGLFKIFFDVLEHGALAGKPVLIAATAGSPRHSLALEHAVRPLFSYMRALGGPDCGVRCFGRLGIGDQRRAGALGANRPCRGGASQVGCGGGAAEPSGPV